MPLIRCKCKNSLMNVNVSTYWNNIVSGKYAAPVSPLASNPLDSNKKHYQLP